MTAVQNPLSLELRGSAPQVGIVDLHRKDRPGGEVAGELLDPLGPHSTRTRPRTRIRHPPGAHVTPSDCHALLLRLVERSSTGPLTGPGFNPKKVLD